MEKTDSGWKVYDVVIDGASLVTTYRGSFNDEIRKCGIDGLIKALEERNRTPDHEGAAEEVSDRRRRTKCCSSTGRAVLRDACRRCSRRASASRRGRTCPTGSRSTSPPSPASIPPPSRCCSSGAAWRSRAARRLEFANLPANLLALAELYGVAELIQAHRTAAA